MNRLSNRVGAPAPPDRHRRLIALLVLLLATSAALPAMAADPVPPAEPTVDAIEPKLIGKDFRLAIAGLDRQDPAVRFALEVRREGQLLIATGGTVMGVTLVVGALDAIFSTQVSKAPFIVGTGIPLGLVVLITGVPSMLASQHFFGHYLRHQPSTRLGRLRMMRAWRTTLFKLRRDAGLIGSAFLGAIAVLSGVVWAARDGVGVNGVIGGTYSFGDMYTTLAFAGAGGACALFALIAQMEYADETETPHRLYARVSGGIAPLVSRDGDAGLAASLTIVF